VGALAHLAPAVSPPPQLAERLFRAVEGPERFERHAPQVATLFDVDEPRARELLRTLALSGEGAWLPGPVPQVQLMPVTAGPARAGQLAGFARMRAGTRFPTHRHQGLEQVLVLQGGMREDSGQEYWPGELNAQSDGSSHGFDVLPGVDCLVAVLLEGDPVFA
jgi:putative transcriptional regulator